MLMSRLKFFKWFKTLLKIHTRSNQMNQFDGI